MRRSESTITVNVFPFLSVLCCLIGVLILFMLIILSTRAVNARDQPAPVVPYEGSQFELSESEHRQIQMRLQSMTSRLEERSAALQRLVQQRDALRALLALQREQQESVSEGTLVSGVLLDDHPVCKLIPIQEGDASLKQPRFIEVDSQGYVTQPGGKRFAKADIPALDVDVSPNGAAQTPLQATLHELFENREEQYVVFLIRPNGIRNFDRVKRFLRRRYPATDRARLSALDMGWEPFSEDWAWIAANQEEG